MCVCLARGHHFAKHVIMISRSQIKFCLADTWYDHKIGSHTYSVPVQKEESWDNGPKKSYGPMVQRKVMAQWSKEKLWPNGPKKSFVTSRHKQWCQDSFNTLRQRQNGHHFSDDVFKCFSWMKMYKFWLRFHWSLFPRVQLTIFQHLFR